ncbi:hypothetical protein [Dorea sp. AM58-8]|uniref:hypothetical protein n=1 Tax=Dorea sp. AM58-8 TaxID=2292346 RepID=UPI000E4B639E|nr:hypothetical protein [Dorea sp. AM58-8]RGY80105.1 hypothetical protein DXA18_10230 [Dorea sp. AM58-8]
MPCVKHRLPGAEAHTVYFEDCYIVCNGNKRRTKLNEMERENNELMSLQAIGDALNLNPIKVRKLLITAGVYESEVAEKVQDTFEKYRETQD